MGGIMTAVILAVARTAGETAPLLICDSIYNPTSVQLDPLQGVPSIPMYIFTTYDLPTETALTRAWGAALVLLTIILVANVGAGGVGSQSCQGGDVMDREMRVGRSMVNDPVPGRVRIRSESVPQPPAQTAPTAAPQAVAREAVFDIRDMAVFYVGARLDIAEDLSARRHRSDRPVRVRQIDVHPQPQPDERRNLGIQARRTGPLSRSRCVRAGDQPRRGAPPHRDGVPEAKPIPEIDLRQCRMGAAQPRHEGEPR
jgi:hypothetical protein